MPAATGWRDDTCVFVHDSATANTEFFRALLQEQQLFLPSTTCVHQGSLQTWHSPDGEHACRIDYVALPSNLGWHCFHSTVLQDFDLGCSALDHLPAAAQLDWTSWQP